MSRALLALAAAAALAACKGADYWADRLHAEPLYRRAEQVAPGPSCAKLIPMEFGRTFPIPAPDKSKRFSVLYYPLFVSPGKSQALSPQFEGRFAAADAAQDACSPWAGAASPPRPSGAPVPAGLSNKAYYEAAAALYPAADKAASLYFSGAEPAAADKAALDAFLDAFTTLAEPGLLGDYYRQNPDFWEWLRRAAGRSIPKA